jgi:hemoglobin/transferrin/lactoferrin receptor protein
VRRNLLVGLIFLFANQSFGQLVQVLNSNTSEPVPGAIVFDESRTLFVESDGQGYLDLGSFTSQKLLIVQHPAFHPYQFAKSKIDAQKSVIMLQERIINIDEVVISASKWEEKKSEIPFEILTLNANGIDFSNVQTAADALEATGQVFVQKSQLGGGSPMMRGFGANAVLIVVDGVRMNNAIFRGGNLQNIISIDPSSLESSEVIFGPGTVMYGSDALGGVMDFHTKSPKFSINDTLAFSGQAFARFSSANNEKTTGLMMAAAGNRWGYLGNITFSDFGDLTTGSVRTAAHPDFGKRPEYVTSILGQDSVIMNDKENVQRFSGYKQFNTLQKLAIRMNGMSELTYTFNFSNTNDIPRYERLIMYDGELLENAVWYYGPQRWMMHALKLKYFRPSFAFDAMKITTALQNFEESRHDRKYRRNLLRNRTERVGVFSINADFDKALNTINQFFYGIEYVYNCVNSSAFAEDISTGEIFELSTRYPDGGSDVNSVAAYLSFKRKIQAQFYLNAGLRYNYQQLYARFNGDQFDFNSIRNINSSFNGNFGLVYLPRSDLKISGLISSGFRAPNVDDISRVFDSEPGNVVVPNPALRPEYSYNTEVSATIILNHWLEVHSTVFYSFLRDAMVRADFAVNGQDSIFYDGELSKVQALINTGSANVFGFNVGFKMDISNHWSATGSLNLTDGRDLEADEPLRHTTPVFGMAGVQYTGKKFRGEFFTRFNGKRSLEQMPASERNKQHLYSSDGSLAWFTLNFRSRYNISNWLGLNAAIENILDHHYRTYSSGISAPGRNFVISLRASF